MKPTFKLALASVAVALACDSGASKGCTEIGCQDQLVITATSDEGTLPAGLHVLEVTVGGAKTTCSFTFPLASGAGGVPTPGCPLGTVGLFIAPAQSCTTTDTPSGKTQTCTAIPGKFGEVISVFGGPTQVSVRQTVDGIVFLEKTEAPTYASTQPNGPGCAPICRQASVTWTFPPPAAP